MRAHKCRSQTQAQTFLQSIGLYCKHRVSAAIAPAVERTLGKGEVACSNHAGSTIFPMLNNINPLNTQAIVMFNIR